MSITPARRQPAHRAPVTTTPRLDRRGFLRVGGLTVAGAAMAGTFTAAPAAAAVAPRFAGDKPGKIYLGVSTQDFTKSLSQTGPVGLRRTYYRWSDVDREVKNARSDHAAGRMPWISFKPATSTRGGWAAIAAGRHDSELRARARGYGGLSRPVIVTYNHEPHNDSTGTPAEFAKATTRIYDVMKSETGLKNVVFTPIIGDWAFNPINKQVDPEEFLTGPVLERIDMCGVDLYQNSSGQGYDVRLGRIFDFLDKRGHSQMPVGVGETGCTMDYRNPDGVTWWKNSWAFAVKSGRVPAISYFNSQHNNNSGNTWVLTESSAKLAAFKASLTSTAATKL
jgi:hypothetical protein